MDFFAQGKARGGDIAGSMATTSNAAMRKMTPFHVALFRKQTTGCVTGLGGRDMTPDGGYVASKNGQVCSHGKPSNRQPFFVLR